MQTQVSSLAALDVLVPLVADFRDTLGRTEPDDTQLKDVLRRLIMNGEADFFLGTDEEGHGIGYVQQHYRFSFWRGGLEATVEDLFVATNRRRRGVATALVRFAIDQAKSKGCRCIKLDTNERNDGAIRLYQKFGFELGSPRFPGSRQLMLGKFL